ncbi:MAG: Sugar transferase involved in lipopolysaccharide synthesis [Sphingobacteriales bacterium]|nr:Sugar transferase involved in lipopolysaccharide synthesis [Sphingobacteriales bacterium]
MYKLYFKRAFDLIIAITVMMLLLPLFLIVMLVLFIANNGSAFFTQIRPGKDEKLFKILKFKTMNDKVDAEGNYLPDHQRLTAVGKIVRKTSLDELPQLINVINGDMSLIGPRPLLPQYLPFYSEEEKLRHTVRPGITGWAQINGRNLTGWQVRLKEDVYYVKNLTLLLDLKIVLHTIKNVLSAKDVVVDPTSYMEPLDIERSKENLYTVRRQTICWQNQLDINASVK